MALVYCCSLDGLIASIVLLICTSLWIKASTKWLNVNLVLSKLTQTQTHFNGTNFFNARLTQRVFSVWPVAQPLVGEMEMDSVANLGTLQTPLAAFFPSKKRQNLVSGNHRYCCASARSCSPSARAHTVWHTSLSSLSLVCSVQRARTSLSLCVCSAQGRERSSALIQLNTDIMLLL